MTLKNTINLDDPDVQNFSQVSACNYYIRSNCVPIYLFGPRFEAFIVLPVFSGLHQSLVLCSIWFSFSGYIYDMCNTAVKLISSLTGRLLFSYSYSWVFKFKIRILSYLGFQYTHVAC